MESKETLLIQEFLPRIKADIDQRFPIASFFLLLMLILRFTLKIPLPDILFLLVSILILTSIPIDYLIDRVKIRKPNLAVNYYFGYLIFDLFLLTLIINFVGGINWIIPAIYLFYIITIFWLFPRSQAIFLIFWLNFLFILLVFGHYFEIFHFSEIFLVEGKNPQNLPFVLTTTIAVLAILVFLGYSSDNFYRLLENTIEELGQRERELTLAKKFLQEEVEKRTEELQKERERLKKLVEEKTRELQERRRIVVQKVKELERFHKIAVLRELKMAEIKEKIERLKSK